MHKTLFLRRFKKAPDGVMRTSGTHIKMRDYFLHCLQHPQLEPYLYFTPDSEVDASDVWAEIPRDRIVRAFALEDYPVLFLTGKDWRFLPKNLNGKKVINLLQSLEQCEPDHQVFRYLKRPAYRISASYEIGAVIRPHVTGVSEVIEYGIPLQMFKADPHKKANSILIWAKKQPEFGAKLFAALQGRGLEIRLLADNIPREQFAQWLGETDIFVALPLDKEGFYLPALEGMASGCVIICPDALGNRAFCIHEKTCLMPKFGNLDEHLQAIDRLLRDRSLKESVRRQGMAMAQSYSMEKEREKFFQFLEKFIFA